MPDVTAKTRISTPLNGTEDPDRVAQAIRNLFPDADCTEDGDRVVAEASDLSRLRDLIEDQEIQSTARTQLRHGRAGDRIRFELAKQAAFAGAVNFSVGDVALGVLEVEVLSDDVDVLVDRLAPAIEPSAETGDSGNL